MTRDEAIKIAKAAAQYRGSEEVYSVLNEAGIGWVWADSDADDGTPGEYEKVVEEDEEHYEAWLKEAPVDGN